MQNFLYNHKSGAKIIFIKNNDFNRAVSIAFKTPAKNNKGTFHVLEHIILTGSKKYNCKDPFNELLKNSLHTYLNAITYNNKTVFPLASYDEDELKKMMDVYLDGVFNPLLKKDSFLQEGINFKIKDNKIVGASGIVYNEMNGFYSNVAEYMIQNSYDNLFLKGSSKFSAGGVPSDIINLTYEDVLEAYNIYYKPSNAYIYLYGDLKIDYYLDYLDKYLYRDDSLKVNDHIEPSNEIKRIKTINMSDSDYLVISFLLCNQFEYKLILVMDILICYFEMNGSLLKKLLLLYCDSVELYYDKNGQYNILNIVLKNCKKDLEFIEEYLNKIFNMLLENFIDMPINQIEFYLKEENYGIRPKGLGLFFILADSFLYGENPFNALEREKFLEEIKKDNDIFKKIILDYFINNKNVVYNILERGSRKDSYSYKQIENIKKDNEKLILYQNLQDKSLNLKKAQIKNKFYKNKIFAIDDDILFFESENDIFYLNFYFPVDGITKDEMYYVGLIIYLLCLVRTKNYSLDELNNKIINLLGGIVIDYKVLNKEHIIISLKGIYGKLEEAILLIQEIINNSVFENINKEIFLLISEIEMKLHTKGHEFSNNRVKSYYMNSFDNLDKVKYLDFYYFLKDIAKGKNIDYKKLDSVYNKIFKRNNLITALSCQKEKLDNSKKHIKRFINSLPIINSIYMTDNYKESKKNENIIINSNTCFNSAVITDSKGYSGEKLLLSHILENDYLLNKVRLEGGAYGYGSEVLFNGDILMYSFKDPNFKKTVDIFKDVKNYKIVNVNDYVIGVINNIYRPIHFFDEFNKEVENYLLKKKNRKILHNEILNVRDIKIEYNEFYFMSLIPKDKSIQIDL